MLNTVGRFIYTKYWEILYVEHCGKIYLHKILGNALCWTLGIFIYIKYWEILYVEYCGKIYLHNILRNTLCWIMWEDLFTQNTGKDFMLNTVGRFIYTKYCEKLSVKHYWKINIHKILGNILCWTLWEDLFTQNTWKNFMLDTGNIYLHKILWNLYVEHCGKICLHTILENTLCWTLLEDLFAQNTGKYLCWTLMEDLLIQNTVEYFMLSTVGIFIYTKYREILYVEHCENIYLHKILGNTLCWTLCEDLFTQNTRKCFMLDTGNIYLHKILGNTLCWILWEDLFTQYTAEYFILNNVGRFIYTKYWEILYAEHCGKI